MKDKNSEYPQHAEPQKPQRDTMLKIKKYYKFLKTLFQKEKTTKDDILITLKVGCVLGFFFAFVATVMAVIYGNSASIFRTFGMSLLVGSGIMLFIVWGSKRS